MNLDVLFAILVVLGFLFRFLAEVPVNGLRASLIAWGLWLVAAVVWAVPKVGVH